MEEVKAVYYVKQAAKPKFLNKYKLVNPVSLANAVFLIQLSRLG